MTIETQYEPIRLIWYQGNEWTVLGANHAVSYQNLMQSIALRQTIYPDCTIEHVLDEKWGTINFCAESKVFEGLEDEFRQAGFSPKEFPNDGLAPEERKDFKELILQGGKLNG